MPKQQNVKFNSHLENRNTFHTFTIVKSVI
jgi:hypothetical protein